MAHAAPHQLLVQVHIHLIEEILIAAVDHEGQFAVAKPVRLIDDRMCIPAFGILFQFTQLFFHLPRIGERADVHATRGRTCGPEAVLMAQSRPQSAVTTHAEARDGTSLARGDRQVVRIDPVGELLRHEGFELRRGIEGAVPIPAVLAVGTGDDHAVSVGQRTPGP